MQKYISPETAVKNYLLNNDFHKNKKIFRKIFVLCATQSTTGIRVNSNCTKMQGAVF